MAQYERVGGTLASPIEVRTSYEPGIISGLREQIKSNAGLLFPHAAAGTPQLAYDVVIMTSSMSEKHEPLSAGSLRYQAVVTFVQPGATSMRAGSVVALGQPQGSVAAALQGLLDVLAAGLEKYQGNVIKKPPANPVELAGGIIDEAAILGNGKSWTSTLFGGDKQ